MKPTTTGTVVDLQGARVERRLEMYRARVNERLRANRAAVEALYAGGQLFSPQGTRAGRALLRAQQLLQRANGLVELLSGEGVVPAPRRPESLDAHYRELDILLARSDALSGRHHRAASVARLPGR